MITLDMLYNKNKYSTQNYFSQEKHINLVIFFHMVNIAFGCYYDDIFQKSTFYYICITHTYACIDTCITTFPFWSEKKGLFVEQIKQLHNICFALVKDKFSYPLPPNFQGKL